MRARWTVLFSILLAAVVLVWTLRPGEPAPERATATEQRDVPGEAARKQDPPSSADAPEVSQAATRDTPVDTVERARFNEQTREFFAQAPALSPEEARRRADQISQELSRIEQAGGLSAGETFLIRAGLIRATERDERQQAAQINALKERYQTESRQRMARSSAQSDPMFELYKVRENQIVAEVLSLQTIPDGLSRDEYLRRRLQAEREQLLGDTM